MKTFRTKKNYLIRIIAAIFTVAAVFSALICFALHFYNSSISYTSSGFAPAMIYLIILIAAGMICLDIQ